MLSALLAHGGVAGALIELAVLLGVLALFAGIAWVAGRRALADQDRALRRPVSQADEPPPPPLA